MDKINYSRFVLVKDNFYSDPKKVIEAARNADFFEPEEVTGFRSRAVYHEPNVKQKLETILGIKITRWDVDPILENGVFYHGFSNGSKKEVPGVHADYPINDITVLIYLTPGIPYDCGTSLWQHKKTGMTDAITSKDLKRLKMKKSELHALLENDSKKRNKWIEIDRVGNKFNRMVAYPSGAFHSATRHFGDALNNGRIYQTFRIGVDWSTLKMNNV